ncbi:uracil phosphoribosyltransferase homolog [Apus apus]|uniref:uracil phosphoribosyltransferase homolog n=1 Tax=Apus apus TaxID=8895 RepID=UPI0021F862C3|nr:uracil phosphoribosyltransferase homolog [Apus apus]XP_051485892.1 uracil phosphoribosyltransferase homolog [Apus apus]XP_051485893.1 uracil phosphoribosyltransferase homolog [Apus apus]
MEAMPCQSPRLGPRAQDEQAGGAGGAGGGGARLIRFAEPGQDSGCPSPDSSSGGGNGIEAAPAPPIGAGEGGAAAIGPQLKLLPMNDQLRELQTIIRDKKSSRGDFVFSADRLIRLVVEEGLNQLPYTECTVTTPTGHKYEGVRFEKGNCGVSIMRSGEAMEQGLRDCCRSIRIGKILIQSDEETQRAKVYYAKFPPDIYRRKVLLMYPILSTGNTVIEAVKVLVEHGVQPSVIILLSLFSTPHGAKSIIQEFPEITILTTEVHPVAPTHFGQKYFGTD